MSFAVLVDAAAIHLVDEEVCQKREVGQTLQDAVHVAGVAQVPQSGQALLVRAPGGLEISIPGLRNLKAARFIGSTENLGIRQNKIR